MSDINFDDPFYLGRVNLTLDGSVWSDLYSDIAEPFFGTGAVLDLTEFYQALGYDPRDDIDRLIDENLEPYTGQTLDENSRRYFGRNALRYKLEGMRAIWDYIVAIYQDSSGGDILDVFIIQLSS